MKFRIIRYMRFTEREMLLGSGYISKVLLSARSAINKT